MKLLSNDVSANGETFPLYFIPISELLTFISLRFGSFIDAINNESSLYFYKPCASMIFDIPAFPFRLVIVPPFKSAEAFKLILKSSFVKFSF